MTKQFVSVIIPTYNEEKSIRRCLQSLKTQTYINTEIVVVDSLRTSDETFAISKKYTKESFKFGNERSQQRNFGVGKTKGNFLLFIDADMELESSVIAECVEKVENGSVAVIIPEKSVGTGYWAKCKALEKNMYIGDETIEAPRFFDKKLYLKLGGYNEKMVSGEDWDLGKRFKKVGKVDRIKSLIYHHEGRLTLKQDLKKKLYYAKKADAYLSENVIGPIDILKFIIRPAYIKNWRMLAADPLHSLGFIVMKISELVVGGFGAIFYKKRFWQKLFS
jgi:glycosyltransferase involved in cell wall biosynthesis